MSFYSSTLLGTALLGASLFGLSFHDQQPKNGAGKTADAGVSAAPAAGHLELLTPQNSTLLLIDHQPQMFFGVQSHDRQAIRDSVQGLSEAAKVFGVPTTLTTVAAKTFSGPLISEIRDVFPDHEIYDRTSMNTWDDKRVVDVIKKTGRKKLVIAALWTEVCLSMPTIEALGEGLEVYIVTDASGGQSKEAHDMAVARMVQAGAVPVTWQQVMFEWQRDWARKETYDAVNDIVMRHSGAFGVGVNYARSMIGGSGGH